MGEAVPYIQYGKITKRSVTVRMWEYGTSHSSGVMSEGQKDIF
ncbi:hypothetical protein D2M30_1298 [Bacillus amyloliquefaciens]|nr:hypothetical protein [Bacillus amyloliquefaciens]QBG55628.1 hypothetical protein D2M30_1298 [Bacillus amyloliquefaciens]